MDIRSILENAQRQVSTSYDTGVHSLMERLGLEQKRSSMEVVMPALAIFGAGLAVGAALGVMFAPKRGDELRTDLAHRAGDLRDRSVRRYEELREKGSKMLESNEMASTPTNGARVSENA